MSLVMPVGEYAGQLVEEIPTSYLRGFVGPEGSVCKEVALEITRVLQRRGEAQRAPVSQPPRKEGAN